MKKEKLIIVGSGVVGINLAFKLVSNKYSGEITIIDKGKDPYNRPKEEVMLGFAGGGLKSDGKYCYLHNAVGGHLVKYCGEEKAQKLVDEGLEIIKFFHPDQSKIMFSSPQEEPEFIKPYFNLRMAPVWHIGTNYLDIIGKKWYNYLLDNGVKFLWDSEIEDIDFDYQEIFIKNQERFPIKYDKLVYATGKSGVDLTQKLIEEYELETEPKSVQLGVRMEVPQKYFQKLVDLAYDFKLYQRFNDKVSSRTFCSNNHCAYVAEEVAYGMKMFNGHSLKDESYRNNMTNFGIIMEIKGIKDPFKWAKDIVEKCQINEGGLYYSPNKTRKPSLTVEGSKMKVTELDNLDLFKKVYGEYAQYIISFIEDLNKVFKFENDYGIFIPEVKFLSEEVLVNYDNLSLKQYPNVYFAGDSLSARGIAVSTAQGLYIAEDILKSQQILIDKHQVMEKSS